MHKQSLLGCHILYTRNYRHMQNNGKKLIDMGAKVSHLPLMDTRLRIISNDDLHYLKTCDYIVFTSQNAVEHFFQQNIHLSHHTYVCIGEKTRQTLKNYSSSVVITAPSPFNTESLLQIWRPSQKKIAIIAAKGGRQILKETLHHRNQVKFIYSYERYNPSIYWPLTDDHIDVAIINSQTTLTNLLQIVPQTVLKMLKYNTVMASLSQRISDSLKFQGFQEILTADIADESKLITLINQWWQQRSR